jgi:RecA-family ATPase
VKLILLDTLQALTTGDTNTVEATQPLMNEATALASATGACVLLVHHVAKGSTKGNPDST